MSLERPIITCITICKDCKNDFEMTMNSILRQDNESIEVVVIDGGSTDGTTNAISNYHKKFIKENIKFTSLSEPDNGIYDAMNKGIDLASGEWLIFMNAGDRFASDDVINSLYEDFTNKNVDVLYGDFYIQYSKDEIVERLSNSLEMMNKALITCHQAIFTRAELMKKRKFCEKYKIIADYEWYLNLYLNKGRFLYVSQFVCVFDGNGISSTREYDVFCECLSIRKEHKVLQNSEIIIKVKKVIMYCLYRIQSIIKK